jgi:phosphotransferase system  glucose/maltose/N-acetylglucosamine-specific IIC component
MKEATGEVSMTVITLVAIAVIGAILAFMWPSIKTKIQNLWSGGDCPSGQYLKNGKCVNI